MTQKWHSPVKQVRSSITIIQVRNQIILHKFTILVFLSLISYKSPGTYVYMAPEVIRCEPYNEKSDVYSFAVILNELITGDYPYIETDFGPSKVCDQSCKVFHLN